MLAAYFHIPESAEGSKPPPKPPKPPPKKAKQPKQTKAKPKRKDQVRPFESGTHYARFEPAMGDPTSNLTTREQEILQQLLQPGSVPATNAALTLHTLQSQEDDNTDASSCKTFDDDTIDTASCGTSEANEIDSPRWVAAKPRKSRPKPSEVPVYTGPELWYEDDAFIV